MGNVKVTKWVHAGYTSLLCSNIDLTTLAGNPVDFSVLIYTARQRPSLGRTRCESTNLVCFDQNFLI